MNVKEKKQFILDIFIVHCLIHSMSVTSYLCFTWSGFLHNDSISTSGIYFKLNHAYLGAYFKLNHAYLGAYALVFNRSLMIEYISD